MPSASNGIKAKFKISIDNAISIAKKEYLAVTKIPKDTKIIVELEDSKYIITFMSIKVSIQPGGTYNAKFVIDANTGIVLQRIAADA